jgi:hypothetical protein
MRRLAAVCVAVLAASTAASAQKVYKWTDESGRVHFSNVGPADQTPEDKGEAAAPESAPEANAPSAETSAPPTFPESAGGEAPFGDAAAPPPVAPPADEKPSRYSKLSTDGFSVTATQRRAALRRDLTNVKRRIAEIDRQMEELRRTRRETVSSAAERLQGVTIPPDLPSEEEKDLAVERKEAEKRIEDIRNQYAELRDEATKRSGSAPDWLLPIE